MYEASNAGKINRQDATHKKGWQMRYKAMLAVGFVVGFIVGARAGRERYDQLVKYGHQIAEHPTVQKATSTVSAKTSELTKTAVAKAPDFAKTAGAQAKQMATAKLRGKGGGGEPDDVTADGHLVYPADDAQASVNGTRYNAE